MSQDTVYEAIAYAVGEKKRRLEYYEDQIEILTADVERIEAELRRLEHKTGVLPLEKD